MPVAKPATPRHGIHGGALEHGGVAFLREVAAAGGVQEPPPERFSRIFRRSEWSNPVNEGQRARLLGGLQQQYGNRFVQRVLTPNTVGEPRAGERGFTSISRSEARDAPGESAPGHSSLASQMESSGGHGLDPATRGFMESRFGRDFGGVSVHDDANAHQAAKGLSAEAFTAGRDVYFSAGAYNPSSESGQHLLAHELAHVVQHDTGAASAAPQGFTVSRPGDALERQADSVADAVMRGEMFAPVMASPSSSPFVSRVATPGAGGGSGGAGTGGGAASSSPTTARGAGGTGTQAVRAGDIPLTVAGQTLVLPFSRIIERAAPGGRVDVPRNLVNRLAVPNITRVTDAYVELDETKNLNSVTANVAVTVPQLEGTGSFTVDKRGSVSGSAQVVLSPRNIPGIKETTVNANFKKDSFDFGATVAFDLPKVSGNLSYKYQAGKHSGKGTAKYVGSKMSGSIEIIMSEAGKISGSGMLDMELFKGLRGQVEVGVDEKRNIKVKGKLSLPGQVQLFPEKKIEKSFFSFEKKFPLWGIVVPVIDMNVGLFAEVHAGAGFRAKFGPGVLRGIELTGEFGSDPEAATQFGLGGEFFVPAGAEIVINAGGGIGLGLAIADITGGVEAVGVAGIYSALSVRPQFQYNNGKYTISGVAELMGVAQAKFGINAFAKIDVGVWMFKGTVWRKDWKLAEWAWNLGLNVGLRANISYTLGEDFAPDISFDTPPVDAEKLVRDVMPDSGSPVPAPPRPPVADRGTLNVAGAQGQQVPGAPAQGPTPPTPGSPPARTQPGTAPPTQQPGRPGTQPTAGQPTATAQQQQPPAAGTPEHTASVQAGLAAIDREEQPLKVEGKVSKDDADKVAAKVKREHPIFKTLTVIDGGESWDFDYTASPGATKKGAGKGLVAGEGDVGAFKDLRTSNDNLTPHHMPQSALIQLFGVTHADGICLHMEQRPGNIGRHTETRTYGSRGRGASTAMDPNAEMEADIADVREIYRNHGLLTNKIQTALREVRNRNKANWPHLYH
jgi:hypothetical protein